LSLPFSLTIAGLKVKHSRAVRPAADDAEQPSQLARHALTTLSGLGHHHLDNERLG
jgi:hypothetical protein